MDSARLSGGRYAEDDPSLEAFVRSRRRLAPEEWLSLVVALVDAVTPLHETFVVHGQLSPLSFRVRGAEHAPTVTLASDAEATWTQEGPASASGFIAPERRQGEDASTAGDVWSIAALMYFCLEHRSPFPKTQSPSEGTPPLSFSAMNDRALLPFVPLLERALEWRPEARFADAPALGRAIALAARRAMLVSPNGSQPETFRTDSVSSSDPTDETEAATRSSNEPRDLERDEPTPDSIGAGTRLADRFQLSRLLGAGAAGSVYEAFDERDGRAVALKILHRRDAGGAYRLKREFRSLSEVAHPNLAALYELLQMPSGRLFFTMELVHGVDFVTYARPEGNVDVPRLLAALAQLVRGVRHLHSQGRVHRDLKPSNVLVTEAGRVVIVDFGLTESAEAVPLFERDFTGTPAYAAPEQVERRRAGPASDWYAVGVILYQALTGRLPFRGAAADILASKVAKDPPSPSEVTDGLPEAIVQLCLRLLAREPVARGDGADVLAVLGVPAETSTDDAAPPPFVGRENELERLRAALESTRRGRCVVVLLSGVSGMGKTALVRHFAGTLESAGEGVVLGSRCHACETVPYKAIDGLAESLAGFLLALPDERLDALIPPDAPLLGQLFPVLRRVRAFAPLVPDRFAPGDPRVRAFVAFRRLIARIAATTPTVVVVDDLQWSDADSAALLSELLGGADAPPILFIGVTRGEAAPAGRPPRAAAGLELLRHASGRVETHRLDVGPLDDATVRELVARMAPRSFLPENLDAVVRAAHGHPLLAAELVRLAAERNQWLDPDGSLDDAVLARLGSLAPEARDGFEVVCVSARPLPRDLVLDVSSNLDLAALRDLRLARVTRETVVDGVFYLEPYHNRVAELVRERVSGEVKRGLYSRLADAALARSDDHLEIAVDALLKAGRLSEVPAPAERAAQRATESLAFERAVEMLEAAVDHAAAADEGRLRRLLADACVRAGRTLAAAEHYEAVAGSAEPASAFELRRRAMSQYLAGGDRARGTALFVALGKENGLRLAPRGPRAFEALEFLLDLRWLARPPGVASRIDSRTARERERLRLFWSAAPPLIRIDPVLAARYVHESLNLAARVGEGCIYAQALCCYVNGYQAVLSRPIGIAERVTERALAVVEQSGDYWDVAFVRVMRGSAALYTGRPDRALDDFLPIATSAAPRTELGNAVQTYARTGALPSLYYSGRIESLSNLAESWIEQAHVEGDWRSEVGFRTVAASRFLRGDDPARALEELQLARSMDRDRNHPAFVAPWWRTEVLLYEGRPEEAVAVGLEGASGEIGFLFAGERTSRAFALGTAAAACAVRGVERKASLRRLRRCIWGARLAPCPLSEATLAQLQGTLAWLEGDSAGAFRALARSILAYDRLGMRLRAASVRLALADMGHPDEAFLGEQAHSAFLEEGIRAPRKWAQMYAGGLLRGDP